MMFSPHAPGSLFSLALGLLVAQSAGAPHHQPRAADANPTGDPWAGVSVDLLPKTYLREPEAPLPTRWPPGKVAKGADLSKIAQALESAFEKLTRTTHPHKSSSTVHPSITSPPAYATSTTSIAGLSSNSATSTKIQGVPVVLPIWLAAPGVGVIVIPAVPVPGAVVPPPPGRPTLSVGEDGKPTDKGKERDKKSKSKNGPKSKSTKDDQSSTSKPKESPTSSPSKPATKSSSHTSSSEAASACPVVPTVANPPPGALGVPAAAKGDVIFALGLPDSPTPSPTPSRTPTPSPSHTSTKAAVQSPLPPTATLPPKPISPTQTPNFYGQPIPKDLFPFFGPDNWSICRTSPPCNSQMATTCLEALAKFDLSAVYLTNTIYSSVDPAEKATQDGCMVKLQCLETSQFENGITGADARNAASAIRAAGCDSCGNHKMLRPGCELSLDYCAKGQCENGPPTGPLRPKVRRQADSCPFDDPEDEVNDPIARHEEPDEEFATQGTGALRAKGYPAVAQQRGVLLIKVSAASGSSAPQFVSLENVANRLADNPQLKVASWAGDHIFELALFTKFFTDFPKYKPILNVLQSCGAIQLRFIGILNSPANLVGVDAEINNYKMLYLQKDGPTAANGAAKYAGSPGLYGGLVQYMHTVQTNYFGVAKTTSEALAQISAQKYPNLSKTVEKDFQDAAKATWDKAMSGIQRDNPGAARTFSTTQGCGAKRQKYTNK